MASLLGTLFRILQQVFCQQGGQQNQGADQNQGGQQNHQAGQHDQAQQQHAQPQGSYFPQEPPKHNGQPHHQPHQDHEPHSSVAAPPHGTEHKPHRPYRNENLINQNDEHYKQLRARAHEEGGAMAKCFEESHKAYESGDGARAKELSNEGHAHQREMNKINAEASDWIFHANNTDSQPGEVDLHGLYVAEAITHTERAIQEAQSRGDTEIHLIVGKGLHNSEHVSKLEPAIEDLMQKYNLAAHLDEHNSGVLVVALDGRPRDRALGANEITRRLEGKDEDCVIM